MKFGVSSGKLAVFHNVVVALLLVVKNQHKCLYSVQATEQQKRQRLCFIFKDNVPAAVRVSLYVCANHFTSDCFSVSNYKAGFASTLTLVKGSVSTIPDPATAPEPPISVATV